MPFSKKKPPTFVSAVVVAAGSASRMDGLDKQLAPLGGMPVVVWSIGALEACPRVREIIVVCRGEQIADYYDLVRLYGFEKVVSVVAGGEHRQDSVFAGIGACDRDAEFFAVHDGARPLALPEVTERCIDAAITTGAAVHSETILSSSLIATFDLKKERARISSIYYANPDASPKDSGIVSYLASAEYPANSSSK